MKIITTHNLSGLFNKISFIQVGAILGISILCLITNNVNAFLSLVISAFASCLYTQLLKLSSYSKYFVLYGFPIRIAIIAIPTAILVHKLKSNLLALFVGFLIGQIIYFMYIWKYAHSNMRDKG